MAAVKDVVMDMDVLPGVWAERFPSTLCNIC